MREYAYQGYTASGSQSSGKMTAADEADAREQLRAGGLIITDLQAAKSEIGSKELHIIKPRVKVKDVAWMARNMATTQQAGLPVLRALGMLSRQRAGSPIGNVLGDIEGKVAEGEPLGQSFRKYEDDLGPLACAMVEAGEQSGSLDDAFDRIARFTESQLSVRRKVIGAISYPAAVLMLAAFLFGAVLIFVVPQFKDLYASLGSDKLPLPTRLLLTASAFAGKAVLIAPFVLFGLRKLYKIGMKDPEWRYRLDTAKMRIPVFGKLIKATALARVCSSMAGLLTSGVSLLDALELSARIANNEVFAVDLRVALSEVEQGRSLGTAFTSAEVFPELFTQLVAIGDETGALPTLLERYAATLEEEVEVMVEALTSLLEPLMIVILGGGVGAMLVALYVPMFKVIELIE